MDAKITYLLVLLTILVIRIWVDIVWINAKGTMNAATKILFTFPLVLLISIIALILFDKWYFILIASWGLWSILFNGIVGYYRHKDFFYLSNKWPDTWVIKVFRNKYIYFGFECLCVLAMLL